MIFTWSPAAHHGSVDEDELITWVDGPDKGVKLALTDAARAAHAVQA
jgi:hypothetical protein